MKKIMSAVLLVFVLLVITACGGNGNSAESNEQSPAVQIQQPEDAQNVIDEVAGALDQAQNNDNAVVSVPGEYYTFGDVINLWDEWELVFLENVSISEPTSSLSVGASNDERAVEISNGEIIRIPAMLTNISGVDRPQGLMDNYSVHGSNGEVQPRRELDVAMSLMRDPDLGHIPSIHTSANAGDIIEGYIFLIYVGDGDYWIHWPAHLVSIPVRLPVSR